MDKNYVELTISVLKKMCPNNDVSITAETKIIEDLGLESIDFVDFIFDLEILAGKQIDITDLSVSLSTQTGRRFREVTVSAVAEYIKKLPQ